MTSCPMCGEEIDARAVECPHCGERIGKDVPFEGERWGPYRSQSTLVGWLTGFLIAGIGLSVIAMLSTWSELQLLERIRQGPGAFEIAEANANDARQALIGVVQLAVMVVTVVVFAVWIYGANRNARALSPGEVDITPGWSVGWFFVPIANLFKPYQAVKQIDAASGPEDGTALLGFWWGCWILAGIVGHVSFRMTMNAETPDEMISADQVSLFSEAMSLPLGVLAIAVVRRIHSRQEASYQIDTHENRGDATWR